MDPVNPWLDPAETRRMAERLMQPVREPIYTPVEVGFDQNFIGFSPEIKEVERSPINEPQSIDPTSELLDDKPMEGVSPPEEEVDSSPILTSWAPEPVALEVKEVQAVQNDPVENPAAQFHRWLISEFSAAGTFILNAEADVVFDDGEATRLHFYARSIARSLKDNPNTTAHHLHFKLSGQSILGVVPVHTEMGWLVLGMVMPTHLTPISAGEIREALRQVVALAM